MYTYFKYFKIFDINSKISKSFNFIDQPAQNFKKIDNINVSTENAYLYYTKVSTTNNYIYGLCYEKKRDLMNKHPEKCIPEVHVFNWNGKPIAILKLDQTINTFCVVGDTTIFAINPFIDNLIFQYNFKL